MTNETGTVLWSWNSDAFGTTLANEDVDNDNNDFEVNHRFPGQYFDKESGQHYNYFRDYEPGTGRYLESDPIGVKANMNTYAYVSENPIKFIDIFGLYDTPLFYGCSGYQCSGTWSWPPPPPANPYFNIDIKCFLKCRNKKGANFVCPFIAIGTGGLCAANPVSRGIGVFTGRTLAPRCSSAGFALCNLMYLNVCGSECPKCKNNN